MKKIFYFFFFLLLAGCKEKYDSPVVSPETGYLVVEGFVNSGFDNTTITLSRSTKLENKTIVYEKYANVTVEGDDNSSYKLWETTTDGTYYTSGLNLNKNKKYRLHILTTNGKEYVSDFEPIKTNPPIDSISWKRENGDLQLYVNTHDDLNNTRYYLWEYAETWEIHSAFTTSLKYKVVNNVTNVAYRNPSTFFDPKMYYCWQNRSSKILLLGSTAKLTKDVISYPLVSIPKNSREFSVLYSIEVKQYGLTKEAYEFLEKMKKNSEVRGTVFDPQPSELKGNMRCISDPTEPVIGYIGFCPVKQRRIFITPSMVPNWYYSNRDCVEVLIENISDSIARKGLSLMPTNPAKSIPGGGIETFFAAPATCVDCTLSGNNVKPFFWP